MTPRASPRRILSGKYPKHNPSINPPRNERTTEIHTCLGATEKEVITPANVITKLMKNKQPLTCVMMSLEMRVSVLYFCWFTVFIAHVTT